MVINKYATYERMINMIYYIGLVFVILLILISLDDLVWDIYCLFIYKKREKTSKTISYRELQETIPGLLAVIVAAYREEDVLEAVIDNLIDTNHYPDSMYHVFLGVYPNDIGTLEIADKLSKKYKNVHKIVHVIDGPSSKADNINNVLKNILEFENKNNIRFKGIIIHDSEDVVHPYELLVENYLLNYHKAIQMPVFPLQRMPKFGNIFKNMISGTYADEFAENHYRMLVVRNFAGSFVPSAGTGFALSRDVLDIFPDHNIFPVGSLTEDYKLSLILKQKGIHLHYVLEDVVRVRGNGEAVREFIATRSIFPSTYRAAVKQKTRWIYGVTMQSFKLKDILKNNDLSIATKYGFYKDWKAKFSNLLLGPGYLIFLYFIASLFFNIPIMYVKYSLSWYLMIFLSIMMIERQILRASAVKNVYGYKSAFISAFFPPILPFRMVIGNIINFHATLRAWKINLFGFKTSKKDKSPKWDKTKHEFLEKEVLGNFKRKLGDVLLFENLITPDELKMAIEKSKASGKRLGETLIEEGIVSERDILMSLCNINKDIYFTLDSKIVSQKNIQYFGKDFLKENLLVPIMKTNTTQVFAISNPDDVDKLENILRSEKSIKEDIRFVYSTKESILNSLEGREDENVLEQVKTVEELIEKGYISLRDGIIALKYLNHRGDIEQILYDMGFIGVKEKTN